MFRLLLLVVCIHGLTACVSAVEDNQQFALRHGFKRELIKGQGFEHVLYFNRKASGTPGRLHVYIEGDGKPWVNHRFIAQDPTAALPLMLRLMSKDSSAAVYLGRPCYDGTAGKPYCHPWLWTQGRYSAAVVETMVAALNHLAQRYPSTSFSLIGHSGGGALAMLIAPQVKAVDQLITLAPNLDTEAWTQKHAYTPLSGSLNPADKDRLPRKIRQYHYLGAQDHNLPLDAVLAVLRKQNNAHVVIEPDCGHADCWEQKWPGILRQLGP